MSTTQDMSRKTESVRKDRKKTPLSRSGCYTCKVRHLKCDETQPTCRRCTSTGRRCEGYLPPQSWLVDIRPDNLVDGGERRSHRYFQERTGPELSRYYDESFWSDLVPQASFSQDAIKHCLIAISSFHEKLEANQTHSDTSYQSQYSLQHYGKAIQLLSRAPSLLSTEETLINCILFIWFENLQNNLKNSRRHIESGIKILAEVRTSQPLDATGMIETILAPTLERLKLKADIYSTSDGPGSRRDDQYFIPERFLDVDQARQSFAHFVTWSCSVLRHITLNKNNSDNWHQRSSTLARRLSGIDLFSARLEELLQATRSLREPDKLQAVLLLKINDLVVRIILSAYLHLQESAYDHHRTSFIQIVDLCQEYLTFDSVKDKTTTSNAYSNAGDLILENGVIPHLLFTSAHCRSHLLRRRVIDLLQSYPRHEGVWDSHNASRVANRIAELEKQNLTLPVLTPEGVPESDLIRVLSICFYHSGDKSISVDNMDDDTQGIPSGHQHRPPLVPAQIKISFLRSRQTNTEPSIEEVWLDEAGESILVSSISLSFSLIY